MTLLMAARSTAAKIARPLSALLTYPLKPYGSEGPLIAPIPLKD
jgi:hypothetical protein